MSDLQAAPRTSGTRPPLWRDLNIFVAAFMVMVSVGSMVLFVPLSLLAKIVLPSRQAEVIAFPLGYALTAGVLGYWWWKHGLSPRLRDPAREWRFRWGHRLLAVFNISLLAMFVFSFMASLSRLPAIPGIRGLVLPLVSLAALAPIAVLAGLAMVWSSRARPAVFADTFPAALAGASGKSSTGWSALKPPPPRESLVVVVIIAVIGLMASTLLFYIGTVFGSLGFQGDSARLENVVLPIVGGCYVFYLAIVIFLLGKRSMAAAWVAWAPFLLVVVMVPLLQVFMALFGR